jgi:ABC-2 type transport system permease protein
MPEPPPPSLVAQVSTIAELRWRMFVNSLRTRRGKLELVSRIVVTSFFAGAGLGGFAAAIGTSWFVVHKGKAELLALLLWSILFFWQVFPIMATAFTNNPDSSELLRFPLAYRSYFLIRLAYGLFDPASALCCVFLFGIFLGTSLARPLFAPWAALVLVTFALFNLVLMQMIFAWIERWLAQRRTREIFGLLFILTMLSFQLVGPVMQRFSRGYHPELRRTVVIGRQVQGVFPPGLAADAMAEPLQGKFLVGLRSLLFLGILTMAAGALLDLRIRAQFHGENLSEAAAARPTVKPAPGLQLGWELPGFPPSVAAVFEKEMRYLARSGPMLLTLIMPIFMLVIFRFGAMNSLRHNAGFGRTPDMALPGAAAYALLVLTNLVYNSFGGDGGGMQFFYASPVPFRDIVVGKNLTHLAILILNTALALVAVTYLYGAPHLPVTIATAAGLLFAAPLNFTAGNLLSIYSPKKRDFATFGRQNVSQTTVLASFGVQILTVAVGAGVFLLAHLYHNLWIATLLFLILAAVTIPVYVVILRRLDVIAVEHRETLLAELCRA